ncbi:MAG TPA: universal stress protein [Myxococcota bacterium]|nr:universal stress protein [Myxococcota bacterium]
MPNDLPALPIDHVLHPTDFSPASDLAFVHALAIALRARAALTILHIDREAHPAAWNEFPAIRATLERWGLLPQGSPRNAVPKLGIQVEKVAIRDADPVRGILAFLDQNPAQLAVLATHGRDGMPRWLHAAVAEPVARESGIMTLFVGQSARGFVSPDDGSISLAHVLLPADREPPPNAAASVARGLARAFGAHPRFTLLHVGDPEDMPAVRLGPAEEAAWERVVRRGPVVDEILQIAAGLPADLIVMTTRRRSGFLGALRGSTTERVVRHAPCPMLEIPEE